MSTVNGDPVSETIAPPRILCCAGGEKFPVFEADREHIKKCIPLYRMLYGGGGWADPQPINGTFRFPLEYGRTRSQMECIVAYLRSGVLLCTSQALVTAFQFLAGCEQLETLLALKQERQGIIAVEQDLHTLRCLRKPPDTPSAPGAEAYAWEGVSSSRAGNLVAPPGKTLTGEWAASYAWARSIVPTAAAAAQANEAANTA